MNATTSDGVRIDYRDLGQGDLALVFCPAWCMSRNGFADLPNKLAANHRVLSLDWRGHGASEKPAQDFGAAQLVEDAAAVMMDCYNGRRGGGGVSPYTKFVDYPKSDGPKQFAIVTLSHSGWVGIELRRRFPELVVKLIHLDWIVLPPPPEYMGLVHGLAAPESWEQMRDILFNIWLEGVTDPKLISFVRDEMGSYDGEMWMRSGREIGACIENGVSALQALSQIEPPVPALHIYAQPPDEGYYQAQTQFAQANPWYHIHRLPAHSHFPTYELADEIAGIIEGFVGQNEG